MVVWTRKQNKAALSLMVGGPSKFNPTNSHPTNPIHKAATAEAKTEPKRAATHKEQTEEPNSTAGSGHDINKIAVKVGEVAVADLAAWSLR